MAINVPTPSPNAPQVVDPTPLVESYLNRPNSAMVATRGLSDSIGAFAQYQLQNQKRKLEALEEYSKIAGTSGITAANQIAPNIPGMQDIKNLPTDPFAEQPQQPSSTLSDPAIVNHAQGIGWNVPQSQGQDIPGQIQANTAQIARSARVGGSYALDRAKKYADINAGLSAQQGATKIQQEIQNNQPLTPEQQAVINDPKATSDDLRRVFPNGIPPQVSSGLSTRTQENKGGLATQTDEYNKTNTSVMAAFSMLKQLDDAWNKIPSDQRGTPGFFTKHADDLASGKFPEAAYYNKLRELSKGPLVAGIDPKGRQGPALLDNIDKGIPSLGTSDQTRDSLMGSLYKQLATTADQNYGAYNTSAGIYGGNVPKPNIPSQPKSAQSPYKPGQVIQGKSGSFKFNGGDWKDKNNYTKVQ